MVDRSGLADQPQRPHQSASGGRESQDSSSYLLVFGSLALSFDQAAFARVRRAVVETDENAWLGDVVQGLAASCATAGSGLGGSDGEDVVDAAACEVARRDFVELAEAFRTPSRALGVPFPLNNALLIPLVVIDQLTQYAAFVRHHRGQEGEERRETLSTAWFKGDAEALGLCTGLLSALAVAAAHDEAEFRQYGAAAARLGMLVGLVVDSQAAASGPGKQPRSLSVAWGCSSALARDELTRILDDYHEAKTYISVFYGKHRVTITTSQEAVAPLAQRLNASGLKTTNIGLYGRYHSAACHSRALERLLAFCDAHEAFQLPDAAELALPARLNDAAGSRLVNGPLHGHALRSILIEPPRWVEAVDSAIRDMKKQIRGHKSKTCVLSFGPERSILHSLMTHGADVSLVHLSSAVDAAAAAATTTATATAGDTSSASVNCHRSDDEDAQEFRQQEDGLDRLWKDSDIAVVGMACKVPGADSVNEFWDLLAAGRSQHQEIEMGAGLGGGGEDKSSPSARLFAEGPFRTATHDQSRRWFANLLDNPGHFDHRFFRKTAREAESMDPQQRLLLQVAYQAVAMSGYLREAGRVDDVDDAGDKDEHHDARNVGCFVGVHLSEYDDNVAGHAANVFSATGNLQSFIAGRVSHHFGWRGPSLTVDTACSSSMAAIHQACQAIASGECTGALAAGVNVLAGSGLWFQNLAAAGFLSPTGQCRPFDARADGYCRGEGIGAVFLKRLSRAVADGDPVLGVLAATTVEQNHNRTPIFVPNTPSLAGLFSRVVTKAGVRPAQITVCEAHGTGTAVGDPAEFGAIRQVLGGAKNRDDKADKPLAVGSVKGLLGHTESSSGILSLIKVLLMLNKGLMPPQASFDAINPALSLDEARDRIFIPTRLQPWDARVRVALINNYGASGSNAAAVVMQAPHSINGEAKLDRILGPTGTPRSKQPFLLRGLDDKAICRYAKALGQLLVQPSGRASTLADMSYSLDRQGDAALATRAAFSAHSVEELQAKLGALAAGDESESMTRIAAAAKPRVVLCFGGQVASWVGLDQQLYNGVAIMRKHLDRVDGVLVQRLGARSIFPAVFAREPITDTVVLQTALFATQYACARSWIDAGVRPAALVGHSFGELTALCVAGVLSLEDTLKLIVRRAGLVRDAWGDDKGAMMAVEILPRPGEDANDRAEAQVETLVTMANRLQSPTSPPVSIACYNGPRSFTLAGPSKAMTALDNLVRGDHNDDGGYGRTETRRLLLKVTNAFHSALVDPLVSQLEQGAHDLEFHAPAIPLEYATREDMTGVPLTARFVANHMRRPVYFDDALRRIVRKHASGGEACVFLEAGSNSTVTAMASRALGQATPHVFQGINITNCDDGWDRLTDTTIALWKVGVDAQHWAHVHDAAAGPRQPFLLPPYQFDPDAHHWLDLKAVPQSTSSEQEQKLTDEEILTPFRVSRDDENKGKTTALFRIDTSVAKYRRLLADHVVAHTAPICPGTVQVGFVIDAVHSLRPQLLEDDGQHEPQIQEVQYHSPLCAKDAGKLTSWIEVVEDDGGGGWRFEVFSTEWEMESASRSPSRLIHTTGHVAFSSASDSALGRELARFQRLLGGYDLRALDLVRGKRTGTSTDDGEVEVFGHRTIYRLFGDIAQYGDAFRRLQKLAVWGTTSAGHVARHQASCSSPSGSNRGGFDPCLADAFCQMGGIWTNCLMTDEDHNDDTIYLASGIDRWIRAPGLRRPDEFHILAIHSPIQAPGDDRQQWVTDVFVLDAVSGVLLDVILGLAYVRTSRASVEKMLARLTDPADVAPKKTPQPILRTQTTQAIMAETEPRHDPSPKPKPRKSLNANDNKDLVTLRIKAVIANMSGLDPSEIKDDGKLADLGIDSLTSMELIHELAKAFPDSGLPEVDIAAASDLAGLVQCVLTASSPIMEDDKDELPSTDSTSSSSSWLDTGAVTGSSHTTPATGSDSGRLDSMAPAASSWQLGLPAMVDAFRETKSQTDRRIAEWGQADYASKALPLQTELAVALTLEAFEALGCNIRGAAAGQRLPMISHTGEHGRLVDHLRRMLRDECGGLVRLDGQIMTRTSVAAPTRPSSHILIELRARHPDQQTIDRLTFHAGSKLARVLRGETDGVRVVFGDPVGRELVSAFYAEWPLFQALHAQLEDFVGRLASRLEQGQEREQEPLRVLEMGAGTGGTTRRILPLLARLGVPVVYTFTDLAASFVAAARRSEWAREYRDHPRLRLEFRVHDIEGDPHELAGLAGTQHIVLATNAVHATRSLARSLAHIRRVLRPGDGVLLLLELTRGLCFLDLTFGLFEGWWLFDDGRTHALASETRWRTELHGAGFGLVDWTDGRRPEARIERLILAAADPNTRDM